MPLLSTFGAASARSFGGIGAAAAGAGLDIDEAFSTYLYDGNGSTQTITNNIDLSGEGGLVWIKNRTSAVNHRLYDTERGATNALVSNATDANFVISDGLTAFNSNGFTLGSSGTHNANNNNFASWAFRKASKFFDIVTYTGNGTNGRQISHNLGHDVGMMLIKKTSSADDWRVFHRSQSNKYAALNSTFQFQTDGGNIFGNPSNGTATAPTSTNFTVANDASVNQSGATYVAYLFAHNDGDGDFGPSGDQDVIKCGSYTGNGSSTGPVVNLGFEPQWLMIKRTDTGVYNWFIFDAMRGMPVGGADQYVSANLSDAEAGGSERFKITPTGFQLAATGGSFNASGGNYIYMAIRRGPLAEPTSATDVFSIHNRNGEPNSTELNLGNTHLIDMVMSANRYNAGTTYRYITDRLRGDDNLVFPSGTDAESSGPNYIEFDRNSGNAIPAGGWGNNSGGTGSKSVFWQWKRAPSYFDVVTYQGTGSMGLTLNHNLGVTPEMIWVKNRSANNDDWFVYHSALGNTKWLELNTTADAQTHQAAWNNTSPTATQFTVGAYNGVNGSSGYAYVAYLFASVAGVSKVGSYTGTGNNIDIDCGFSSGARFVLIKRTDASIGGSWWVVDTVRGLTSSNDPIIRLDTNDAEYTQFNPLTPLSSGFTVASTATADFNASGGSYIFYAIA